MSAYKSSPVKHGVGSSIAWVCKAASGTGSLIFFDDAFYDGSNRKKLKTFFVADKCI